MPFRDEEFNNRAQLLMDIASILAYDTQRVSGFPRIPGFLGRFLNLPSVSLAVIRTAPEGAAIVLSAFSGTPVPPSFEQDLLNIHEQTRPLSSRDNSAPRATLEITRAAAADAGSFASLPRATVFAHSIDERHRMLLIVHQHDDDPQLSAPTTDTLQLVARQLGRLLQPLVICLTRPEAIGSPFDRLTDREWIVLRHLDSDAGEKQLADQLGLSPHTLHSHIKSIYRKIGVQGRLQLLLRAEEAQRDLRQRNLEYRAEAVSSTAGERTISAA
jgi:DNA-binding CsgD family transcriptional regulator